MTGFAERLESVTKRMAEACGRAGRKDGDVRLVAVSKTFGPESIAEAVEAGVSLFGESRIQEAKQKIPVCSSQLEWHMIGHLQSNKVKEAVRLFKMIHSVDSLKLLEVINEEAAKNGIEMPVCLEVNVSGEASKFGLKPEDVPEILEKSRKLISVRVAGLMTIPPFTKDVQEARPYFRRLRELRDETGRKAGIDLPELSMGMSNDFEIAIEEGATWIRVGSLLFGDRAKKESV